MDIYVYVQMENKFSPICKTVTNFPHALLCVDKTRGVGFKDHVYIVYSLAIESYIERLPKSLRVLLKHRQSTGKQTMVEGLWWCGQRGLIRQHTYKHYGEAPAGRMRPPWCIWCVQMHNHQTPIASPGAKTRKLSISPPYFARNVRACTLLFIFEQLH